MPESKKLEKTINLVLKNVRKDNYNGWDPYDGMESKIFQICPLKHFRFFRLIWIQLFKRNPINLRRLFLVKRGRNPKGLALFVLGLLNLYEITQDIKYRKDAESLLRKLKHQRSKNYDNFCWGYNFDWQSRVFFIPKNTPNAVCTVFCAKAFLKHHYLFGDEESLEIVKSSGEFLKKNLLRENKGKWFSYTPLDKTKVYNVNLLVSSLFSELYLITKNRDCVDLAKVGINLVVENQKKDGSWFYGQEKSQKFIDGFHTGYNLVCLEDCKKNLNLMGLENVVKKGIKYYQKNFLVNDGRMKYYNNSMYPIDIHSQAQGILTFLKFNKIKDAERIAGWTLKNMYNEKGFFYFQRQKSFTNKINYLRWGQAWMFYSLTELLKHEIK